MRARVLFHRTRDPGMLAGAVALLLILSAFSRPAWAIIGGEPDAGRHPNVAAIVVWDPVDGTIHTISGTLIHPRLVLTAGHVVEMIDSGIVKLLGVSFDQEVNTADNTSWAPVWDVVGVFTPHSVFAGYNADPGGIDIGALVLKEPVNAITPEPLPPAGFLDDLKKNGKLQAGPKATRFTVVGYGMLLDWPPPEPYWQDPPTRNTAESGYLGLNDAWLNLSQNLALGYGGTARGDSGGPVFWTDPETGNEVLVAVTSWGGSLIGNGFYYRIDTAAAQNFIAYVECLVE